MFLDATALSCNAKLSVWLANQLTNTFLATGNRKKTEKEKQKKDGREAEKGKTFWIS